LYLKELELINMGPIPSAKIVPGFNNDLTPKPIVLVGKNGSGKSLAIANIVNALLITQSQIYDNADVEKGRAYKLRSPAYVRNGTEYSVGSVLFSNDFYYSEIQLAKPKSEFTTPVADYRDWGTMPADETAHLSTNFNTLRNQIKNNIESSVVLYFPPNRFEEPAWLNELNLRNKVDYLSMDRFENLTNRPIVTYAPLADLQNWLLDLIYDSNAVEVGFQLLPHDGPGPATPIRTQAGPATSVLGSIKEFLHILFNKQGPINWHIGTRSHRKIGLSIGSEIVTTNMFSLSTGQSILLGMFLSIIRNYDLTGKSLQVLSEISGVVVIDEIDLHLHSELQHILLPQMIKQFPKIQFVVSTHSPLFLTGMEKVFGADGYEIYDFPNADRVEAELFSEFDTAYSYIRESKRYQEELRDLVARSQKPVVYFEGSTDIDYVRRAAELLGKKPLMEQFELEDGVGSSQLGKLWDSCKSGLGNTLKNKTLLLFDCDENKRENKEKGKLFVRVIPEKNHNIKKGIENLFSDQTISKAKSYKNEFIDVTGGHTKSVRGCETEVPEAWAVNKDEKRNMCDWLCENGSADDFQHFSAIFEIIEEFLEA
jgi:hypothetical protein